MVSNICVPKLYGLLKTHKSIPKMRPIVSNIGSPTEKISKWFVPEFKNYNQTIGFSVNNSYDFVDRVKDIEINDDEMLIYFDVEG